jgi:hypothetical protein
LLSFAPFNGFGFMVLNESIFSSAVEVQVIIAIYCQFNLQIFIVTSDLRMVFR